MALESAGIRGTDPSAAALALDCVCLSEYVYTDEYKKFFFFGLICFFFFFFFPPFSPKKKKKKKTTSSFSGTIIFFN